VVCAAGRRVLRSFPTRRSSDLAAALLADDTSGGVAAVDRRLPEPDPWTRAALHLMRAMLNGNRGEMDAVHRDIAFAQDGFREAEIGRATSELQSRENLVCRLLL